MFSSIAGVVCWESCKAEATEVSSWDEEPVCGDSVFSSITGVVCWESCDEAAGDSGTTVGLLFFDVGSGSVRSESCDTLTCVLGVHSAEDSCEESGNKVSNIAVLSMLSLRCTGTDKAFLMI